jgi:hypothetical protein
VNGLALAGLDVVSLSVSLDSVVVEESLLYVVAAVPDLAG